jgi:exonuclease SbcC
VNLRHLHLRHFMGHEETAVDFPPRGVVLVTGANGAGKSALPEAASVAFWGCSLRGRTAKGADVWADDTAAAVSAQADVASATRFRTRSGTKDISWSLPGVAAVEYATPTKAQDALLAVVGSHDVWRRTSVLSSRDLTGFADSTDGERKRLFEALLGLQRLDAAGKTCRQEAASADREAERVAGDARAARERLDGARTRLEDARRALAGAAVPEPQDAVDGARVRRLIEQADQALQRLAARRQAVERAAGGAEREAQGAQARAVALSRMGECPTCGQVVPEVARERAAGTARDLAAVAVQAREQAVRAVGEADEEEEEVRGVRSGLGERWRDLSARASVAAAQARARALAQDTVDRAEAAIAGVERASAGLEEAEAAGRLRARVLGLTSEVLGLRGVRAGVLGRALPGVEAIGGSWLSRLSGGTLGLRVRATTERADGGISDAISVAVRRGTGAWRDYDTFSGGEARRIDVALLLGLREVAAGASGRSAGTLFLDEVADSLDPEGIEGISGALDELSRERCVVLISHSEDLFARLKPAKRLRIDRGTVSEL